MAKSPRDKARAAGAIFDGLCTLLGDEGERLRNAVTGAHSVTVKTLGKDGLAALKAGDVAGAMAEAYRNSRKALRSSEPSSDEETRDDDGDLDPL